MTAALQTSELPPEALALIKEGTPQPRAARPLVAAQPLPAIGPAPSGAIGGGVKPTEDDSPTLHREGEVRKARPHKEKDTESLNEGTVSRSFRLPGNLPTALLRASTERRIARTKPFTQEEIVAEALSQWLKRNGYLS